MRPMNGIDHECIGFLINNLVLPPPATRGARHLFSIVQCPQYLKGLDQQTPKEWESAAP